MKKNVLKKLMCAVLAAACVATAVVPAMADDVVTAEAATKKVTSAYKYHLEGCDKKGYVMDGFSKAAFYKDLNSLPAVKIGKTTINVPAVTSSVKSISKEKGNPIYESFVKFKAPKTGKYVFTLDNLQGTDDKSLKCFYYGFCKPIKNGKKYTLENLYPDTVGNYGDLYENNYLARLRTILDNYKAEHPEYADVIEETYEYQKDLVNKYPVNKIKFTTKLKKGRTYVFVIDNIGMAKAVPPYFTTHGSNEQSCLWGGNYLKAYSFDMNIEYRK
ncbi:MAG: hypothetical protein ACLS4B_03965 [Roseburia faecis]